MPKMNAAELHAFMVEHFPEGLAFGNVTVESVEEGRLTARLSIEKRHLRPGGTVSGPTLMTLADQMAYYLVLTTLGPIALAVTTHISMDFLRRPALADVLAETEMLKLGRRLIVVRVTLRSEGEARPIAHATVTYSVPPAAPSTES